MLRIVAFACLLVSLEGQAKPALHTTVVNVVKPQPDKSLLFTFTVPKPADLLFNPEGRWSLAVTASEGLTLAEKSFDKFSRSDEKYEISFRGTPEIGRKQGILAFKLEAYVCTDGPNKICHRDVHQQQLAWAAAP